MKFESKFNLGDEIYAVPFMFTIGSGNPLKFKVTDKKKVDVIRVTNYINKEGKEEVDISYFNNDDYNDYSEEDCFATLAEAQAECNRRNKEDK